MTLDILPRTDTRPDPPPRPAWRSGRIEPALLRSGEEKFISLDLLRALAAMMIVLIHAHSIAVKIAHAQGDDFFATPPWWFACIDVFFVMSGFLILHTSHVLYGERHGIRRFVVRRAIRIPPLYWLDTLLIAALFLARPTLSAEGPVTLAMIVKSLLFFPDQRNPVLSIGWTLNYEIFFYGVFALTLALPFARGWKACAGIVIMSVVAGQVFDLRAPPWNVWTDPLLLDFVFGMMIAAAFHSGVALNRAVAALVFWAGIVLILCDRHLINHDLYRAATMGLGAGCLVAAVTLRAAPLSFGAAGPVIAQLSRQSYMMYLSHILVLKALQMVYFRFLSGFWSNIGFMAMGMAATLAVSCFLYGYVERPLTEALQRRAQARGLT